MFTRLLYSFCGCGELRIYFKYDSTILLKVIHCPKVHRKEGFMDTFGLTATGPTKQHTRQARTFRHKKQVLTMYIGILLSVLLVRRMAAPGKITSSSDCVGV